MESLDRKYRGLRTKSASLTAKNEELSHENTELRAKFDELNRVAGDSRKEFDEPVVTAKTAFETDPQPRAAISNLPLSKTLEVRSQLFHYSDIPPSSPTAALRAKTPDPDRSQKVAAPVLSVLELPGSRQIDSFANGA